MIGEKCRKRPGYERWKHNGQHDISSTARPACDHAEYQERAAKEEAQKWADGTVHACIPLARILGVFDGFGCPRACYGEFSLKSA